MGIGIILLMVVVAIGAFGYGALVGWVSEQNGRAELAQAEYSRQIAVVEAKAKEDAAESLAKADIARAEGAAKSNQIIGDSLKNNEAYLRYLWIQNLENNPNQVIYVPTEAGIPILEAGRGVKAA